MRYADFFEQITGKSPFPFQARLSEGALPDLLDVPTGLGKTAALVVAWLWRRLTREQETGRRLVYCLPMRALVEQVAEAAGEWCRRSAELFSAQGLATPEAHILMGGEVDDRWELKPERPSIVVGTQDMLLSRALNRGYAMSRYKWPIHFGLLNDDCVWVFDETQLMGVGVETSAQLHAFRKTFGTFGSTHSIWVSATLADGQLNTVDHRRPAEGWARQKLESDDLDHSVIRERREAKKKLVRVNELPFKEGDEVYAAAVAELVLEKRRGGLTLLIANRVSRAQAIFAALREGGAAPLALVHSRFRRNDRTQHEQLLHASGDRIVVATQALEAGVDVSARTLITELAPWPSIVQRLGRCNRYGEANDALALWIDMPVGEDEDLARPYSVAPLEEARAMLAELSDGGPSTLGAVPYQAPREIRPVLRRRDLIDLFDTTPDLGGNDVDVARFVRDEQDTDVQFFWRPTKEPDRTTALPRREELCRVSIRSAREFAMSVRRRGVGPWRWDPLERTWELVDSVRPGQVLLLASEAGGYDPAVGWTGDPTTAPVAEIHAAQTREAETESFDGDPDTCVRRWVRLEHHLQHVSDEAGSLADAVGCKSIRETVATAGAWHDVGKAHAVFQNRLLDPVRHRSELGPPSAGLWAKSSHRLTNTEGRPHFRHELASALAWLAHAPRDRSDLDLIAYLIAAHHGKVRLSIRSVPGESAPDDNRLFARGVWDRDALPPVEVPGSGVIGPTELDLSVMRLGEGSWLERMLRLRDSRELGPIRLALLETIVRVADWRASGKEERGEYDP